MQKFYNINNVFHKETFKENGFVNGQFEYTMTQRIVLFLLTTNVCFVSCLANRHPLGWVSAGKKKQ